jgi:hypothetical protein
MITEIVTFKLPDGSTQDDVFSNFNKTASIWRDNPDLIRKNYLFNAESGVAGGVYLWKEKAHAEKWHGPEFRDRIKKLYGAEPSSQFFETPIVVDNLAGEITRDYGNSVRA